MPEPRCRPVEVDGTTVLAHGVGEPTEHDRAVIAAWVAELRRRGDLEEPEWVPCGALCLYGHEHKCARHEGHLGFHRDVQQKGQESCSWTCPCAARPHADYEGPVPECPEHGEGKADDA